MSLLGDARSVVRKTTHAAKHEAHKAEHTAEHAATQVTKEVAKAVGGGERTVVKVINQLNDAELKSIESYAADLGISPCATACGITAIDAVFFVIGLAGLKTSNDERLARSTMRELGEDTLNGFGRDVQDLHDAESTIAKAKAVFALAGGVSDAGGITAWPKIIEGSMTTVEWVETGATAFAQLTAWFASDGAAFVGEAALTVLSAGQLIEDAAVAVQVCKK